MDERRVFIFNKIIKGLVIAFIVLIVLNVFLPDLFVVSLEEEELVNNIYRPQAIVRWMHGVAFLVLPICAYYDKPIFKKIAVYFCLPVAIIYACMFNEVLSYQTSELGRGIYQIRFLSQSVKSFMINPIFRGILLVLTYLTEIGSIVLMIIKDRSFLKFIDKKEIGRFFAILGVIFISSVPSYVPQYVIGSYTDFILKPFTLVHLAVITFIVAEAVILVKLFKNKPYEDKMILLIIMAMTLFIQYNQMFSSLGELTIKRMPLQLCNIGSYLIIISLLTRNKKLFQFNLIINVAGGIIALTIMDVEGKGLFYLWNMHYLVEHINVVLVPLIALLLGVFKPLKLRDYLYFVLNFTLYWGIVLVLGTIFNGIYNITGNDYFLANYLFMFMRSSTEQIVGFVGPWFDIQIALGDFVLYPVVQIAVLFGFLLIGTIVFFVLYFSCKNITYCGPEEKIKETKQKIEEVKSEA